MCKRTCDKCGSKDHLRLLEICGTRIICSNEKCNRVFEFIFNEEACPISVLKQGDLACEEYAKERSFVNVPEE